MVLKNHCLVSLVYLVLLTLAMKEREELAVGILSLWRRGGRGVGGRSRVTRVTSVTTVTRLVGAARSSLVTASRLIRPFDRL